MTGGIKSREYHPLRLNSDISCVNGKWCTDTDKKKILSALQYCEAFPADNVDILILVTDTPDKETEEKLQRHLKDINSLESLSMTFGYNDELQKGARNDNEA